MNSAMNILLEGQGFRQMRPNSCEFAKRHESSETNVYLFRVWLHRNGGQAEVCHDDTGRKVARTESWCSMDDLKEFFKEFQ
jgi:hypothetical protein